MQHNNPTPSQQPNPSARLFGSALAGMIEISIFHPLDTISKRLMVDDTGRRENRTQIIFREAANGSFVDKVRGLYPGIMYGVVYKVSQRVLRYGGQPVAYDLLQHRLQLKNSTAFTQAVAGSLVGLLEVSLLPLDSFKIKRQTNPKGSFLAEAREAGFRKMYRGANWTAARNIPGQFALFGCNSGLKRLMGLDGTAGGQATLTQNLIASSGGAVASLVASQPMDVIKTRIQARPFMSSETGWQLMVKLVKNEGPSAFLKGLQVKLLVVGPKIAFSFAIAQSLISFLGDRKPLESAGGRYSVVSVTSDKS